ncbi:long-chain fatty acid--CoA ligase [Rhizobium sp. S163]|uniref:class I adenylate-forming enzyme family protein n=1 Tax=Rhizobium sp. S163 TaxID=3055039 RepID=UPI0025A9C9A3|nr:long-chain fatty acid--CoA ligase [Rhizobium sp. S163]MDM9645412.1 long-chain fatty acid--CoA ligase [Rhizobium sp. S163]
MTYIETLIRTLEEAPAERPVLRFQNRDMTASKFLDLISGLVDRLSIYGIAPGHLVGIIAPNRPEALATRYAAHLLGAATCFLSSPSKAEVRKQLIHDIAPDLLVAFPGTDHLVPTGMDCATLVVDIDVVVGAQRRPFVSLAQNDDLAVVVSSGGSTGVPKGSCRDFRSYTHAVSAVSRPDRRQLINGPLAYLSQILVDVTLMNGGYVVMRNCFDAADTLAQIESQKITDLFLVEPQLFELIDHADVAMTDLSSLRYLVHIGASAPEVLRKRAFANLGSRLMHTYGASEMGLVSALSRDDYDQDFTSAGRLMAGVAVRLRGLDGALTDRWTPGIIEVNAPGMAQGYRNRADLATKAFEGGWYRSGDLGYLDDQGRLHIMGRATEIEKIGTRWITPTMMENVLCELACVRYAIVLIDLAQNRRIAAIEPRPAGALGEDQCRRVIEERFSREIANSMEFLAYTRVPRTEQGKPDRAQIWADANYAPKLSASESLERR